MSLTRVSPNRFAMSTSRHYTRPPRDASRRLGPKIRDSVSRSSVVLFFSVMATIGCWAQSYDAAAAFEPGWIAQTNPNGVWSYGYSSGFTGPITLYNQAVQTGVNGPYAQYWLSSSVDIGSSPGAEFNDGPAYDDGNIDFLANEFVLVSGIGGQYSDLVFTAPAAGEYSVVGSFRGDQYDIGTVVGIVVNGSVAFSSSVTSEGQIVPFQITTTLQSGNTVVFSVGPGGGLQNTGLGATITPGSSVVLQENFDELTPSLSVTSAGVFTAINGTNVDLVGGALDGFLCASPESGNCLDLDGSGGNSQGDIETSPITLNSGTEYTLSFDLIGSQRGVTTSTTVNFGPYSQTFSLPSSDDTDGIVSVPITVPSTTLTYLEFTSNTPGDIGALLDNVLITTGTPPSSQTIKQPLNPTQPTQFNFGPHNYTVQYPPGTSFSNVNMSVTAAQTTQATYQQSVAGTQFANSSCVVYTGTGGNCINYQVTCSDATTNSPITCPGEPTPNISVKTSYDTVQTIVNPGFLTAPIGTNQWQNIFSQFYLQRVDPSTKGFTKGFSQFYAVALGASNGQGAGALTFLAPLLATDSRVFVGGVQIPAAFQLMSIAHPGQSITDAVAGLSVVWVSDASGNPESKVVLASKDAFHYESGIGGYLHQIDTTGYQAGTYILTVYGNAFAAQQVQFTIQLPVESCIVPSLSSINFGNVVLNRRKKEELMLTNNCTTEVQISAISFIDVSGDPSDFSARAYCHNQEMRPGHTCMLAVFFTPDALTTDTATLNIVNNPPGGTIQVPITGTGVGEP
jgi:hypothetical protein